MLIMYISKNRLASKGKPLVEKALVRTDGEQHLKMTKVNVVLFRSAPW